MGSDNCRRIKSSILAAVAIEATIEIPS